MCFLLIIFLFCSVFNRGDTSADEVCLSPNVTSTPPASPGYLASSQRVHRLPPLLHPAYLLPRGPTSLLMSPPASPGYLPAHASHVMSPPASPLGCLPARAGCTYLTTPCSPISPASAAASSPMVKTAPPTTRRDGVFFAALPEGVLLFSLIFNSVYATTFLFYSVLM